LTTLPHQPGCVATKIVDELMQPQIGHLRGMGGREQRVARHQSIALEKTNLQPRLLGEIGRRETGDTTTDHNHIELPFAGDGREMRDSRILPGGFGSHGGYLQMTGALFAADKRTRAATHSSHWGANSRPLPIEAPRREIASLSDKTQRHPSP
jgi:hypothetical protein